MEQIIGHGGGGKDGGGSSSPTEAPDSLHSVAKARILDLISEGPIRGLVDGLKSIYLDDTPIQTGITTNFQGATVAWRYGTQDQEYIPGFPSVENELSIGIEVRRDRPWTQDFSNLQLSSLRLRLSVPQLMTIDTGSGDTNGYSVELAVDISVDSGPFQQVLVSTFTGKTTTKYERSHTVALPRATSKWTLRVRRTTANADSSTTADVTVVDAVTEVIDAKLRYPMSAYFALSVDSAYFSSIPKRAYEVYGRIIRVPDNYDPETRTYQGTWSGGFKQAWTNNPAWIFFDVITHERYGLGDRITPAMVDKWTLYQIAQYCDQMVPDGKGGLEPRFACSTQIQSRDEAYALVQNLASVFQGMAYYSGGGVSAVADQPKDAIAVYTNSNVIGGKFNYSGSSKDTRYTVALVSWNDPANMYKSVVEYVEDPDGYIRYGHQEVQLTAFGCTSQGQAQRAGRWALLTSQVETQSNSFSLSMEALISRPGDIIGVMDQDLIGKINGGRISSSTINSVTVDSDVEASAGDAIMVMLPSGVMQSRTIKTVAERRITVTQNFTLVPQREGAWAVEGSVALQYFRVLAVMEKEGLEFELKTIEYQPSKFDAIANGTKIDDRPITAIPPGFIDPPKDVLISQRVVVNQGISNTIMTIGWTAPKGAVAYEGFWRRNEGEWVPFYRTGSTSIEVPNIYAGRYLARVHAINGLGTRSIAGTSSETTLGGKTTPPPVVTYLTTASVLWGVNVQWGLPTQGAEDVQRSELWWSITPNREDAEKLTDLAYPQTGYSHMTWKAGQSFYYWVRLVDRTGNIGAFYPEGAGVEGSTSSQASEYLDAIRDEVMTTDLADQLINKAVGGAVDDALEMTKLMTEAERYIREDEDAIVTRKVDVLSSTVNDTISAAITNLQEIVTTADSALAEQVTTLETRVEDNISSVTDTLTALSNADEALASSVQELKVQVDDEVGAALTNLQQVMADADSALAQSIDTLEATVNDDIGSAITNLQQVVADTEQTLSQEIQTLGSTVGENAAELETAATTLADTNGKLSSLYTMKTAVTAGGVRYGAGIGLGVENDPNGPGFISQILLQADRVALLNTNNNSVTSPFAVQGGQVFINNAVIQDASIVSAKIGDAAITNAKIGGDIWSKNWSGWGGAGWHIAQTGRAHFNDAQIRGTLYAANGTFSGTLTADAINAVRTINIAGNSVTVSAMFVINDGRVWHPDEIANYPNFTEIWSATVYTPDSSVFAVSASALNFPVYSYNQASEATQYYSELKFFVDGAAMPYDTYGTVGPGYHTFSVRATKRDRGISGVATGRLTGSVVCQMFVR